MMLTREYRRRCSDARAGWAWRTTPINEAQLSALLKARNSAE